LSNGICGVLVGKDVSVLDRAGVDVYVGVTVGGIGVIALQALTNKKLKTQQIRKIFIGVIS
jgi:hypothetical protein